MQQHDHAQGAVSDGEEQVGDRDYRKRQESAAPRLRLRGPLGPLSIRSPCRRLGRPCVFHAWCQRTLRTALANSSSQQAALSSANFRRPLRSRSFLTNTARDIADGEFSGSGDMVKVGINGFGRIGRLTFRYAFDMPEVEVVRQIEVVR